MTILFSCENFKLIDENSELIYLIDGWDIDSSGKEILCTYGILKSDLRKYLDRGLRNTYAQFVGLVAPGLILIQHIFEGLERPLYCDNSEEGDRAKIVHTRCPTHDCRWKGGSQGDIVEVNAPKNKVFVIIISRNIRHKDKFPSVHGWIERWNWIEQDKGLSEAPINWVDRYTRKIFTRKGGM